MATLKTKGISPYYEVFVPFAVSAFVFGFRSLSCIPTVAKSGSESGYKISGRRKHGQNSLARNADDNLIAHSRQEERQRRAPRHFDGRPRCKLSPSRNQIDDRGPDGRRQAVPACDQLPKCLSLPADFRPATERRVVTTFRTKSYVNRAVKLRLSRLSPLSPFRPIRPSGIGQIHPS